MERSVKVAKIVLTEFINASRDERELSVCKQLGAQVVVVAKGTDKIGDIVQIDALIVHRCSTRPLGLKVSDNINRIASLFTWAFHVRKIHPDIISGHDMAGLMIGWISTWFMKKKPLLVYDSHEFELGRNANRTKKQKVLVKALEKFLIKKSDLVIMVNDSIADLVKKIYRLNYRPLVIRNVPPRWKIDHMECQAIRKKIDSEIGPGRLLLYHGAISRGRGIEKAIKILTYSQIYRLLILGNAQEKTYQDSLKRYAQILKVDARVLFHDAVPYSSLWKYVGAADLSVLLVSGKCQSYYYSLPNKLFESIQAGVPFLASDFPELKRIIEGYGVGITCNPDSETEIKKALGQIFENGSMEKYRNNAIEAAKELCWEKECRKLVMAYGQLFKRRKRKGKV